MNFLSDETHSVVCPREMVRAFADPKGITPEDLILESLALITFTPFDYRGLIEEARNVEEIEAWKNRNNQIHRGDGWVAVQSPYGAPNAVMLLEELVAFGVKRVVYLGYCGSLQEKVGIGDIVIPTEAVREEGTSYHYLREGERSVPDLLLQKQLFSWMKKICPTTIHVGKIWTTDAPYRETPNKVSLYRGEGILGVDMEMSAAFVFGMVRGISIGTVLLVSDEVRERMEHWIFFPRVKKDKEEGNRKPPYSPQRDDPPLKFFCVSKVKMSQWKGRKLSMGTNSSKIHYETLWGGNSTMRSSCSSPLSE